MDDPANLPIIGQIWSIQPPIVKFGWILLMCGYLSLMAMAVPHLRRPRSATAKHTPAILMARIFIIAAIASCMSGLGEFVSNSGNSIDTPLGMVLLNVVAAQGIAFLVLQWFVPLAAVAFIASYVLDYVVDRRETDGSAEKQA
ncbi:MAG: hypothetical protein ACYTKD_17100 [Planctomycetota bacterium]|jgi:hypothetical protein